MSMLGLVLLYRVLFIGLARGGLEEVDRESWNWELGHTSR